MSQSPPRKKHDVGEAKRKSGVFSGLFLFGVSPWSYSSIGACKSFDIKQEVHNEQDDERKEQDEQFWRVRVNRFHPHPDVVNPQHGDVVDTMGYRGCGTSVLELLNPFTRSFGSHKTWEEYGYTVPPAFSDAPLRYFENTGATSRLIYVPLALEDGSDAGLKTRVAALVAERRHNPTFVSDMTGDTVLVDVNNLQRYCMHFEEGGLASWFDVKELDNYFGEPTEDDQDQDGGQLAAELPRVVDRIRKRRAWLRKLQGALVHETFGKHFHLPRDVSKMIADLSLAVGDPKDALLEPFCEMCSFCVDQPFDDFGESRCGECQKVYCKLDASCSIAQHAQTHRHLSRMLRM